MEKQALYLHQIQALIVEEMTKYKACQGAYPGAYWHREDEGCNWGVDILPGQTATLAQCGECKDRLHDALQALRAKYDIIKAD